MAKIDVFSKSGKKVEELDLNDAIFGVRINKRLLDEVVRQLGNNKRTGTQATKTFSEVSGGGKRPWKQKGTGQARTSSIRNPIWRGGGTIHGPQPRDIYYHVPAKMRMQAILSALTTKAKTNDIVVVDDLSLKAPKTKEFAAILKALKIDGRSMLCVLAKASQDINRASGNIDRLKLMPAAEFNAYHVMKRKKLLLDKAAIQAIEKRLAEII